MSRFSKLRLDVRIAYPGRLGVPQLMLVEYNGQLVIFNGALVLAPNLGQQVNLNA